MVLMAILMMLAMMEDNDGGVMQCAAFGVCVVMVLLGW